MSISSKDHKALLLAFLRARDAEDPIPDFFAKIILHVASMSRQLARYGVKLSEKWEQGDRLKIKMSYSGEKFIVLHVGSAAREQGEIGGVVQIALGDSEPKSFLLPELEADASNFVYNSLVEALPEDVSAKLFELIPENDPRLIGILEEMGSRDMDPAGQSKAVAVALGNLGYEHP